MLDKGLEKRAGFRQDGACLLHGRNDALWESGAELGESLGVDVGEGGFKGFGEPLPTLEERPAVKPTPIGTFSTARAESARTSTTLTVTRGTKAIMKKRMVAPNQVMMSPPRFLTHAMATAATRLRMAQHFMSVT